MQKFDTIHSLYKLSFRVKPIVIWHEIGLFTIDNLENAKNIYAKEFPGCTFKEELVLVNTICIRKNTSNVPVKISL